MSGTSITLAAGQILDEGGKVQGNLDRAVAAIAEGANRGGQIVVLPECLDVGWTYSTAAELAEPIPGRRSDRLCRAAKDCAVLVVAGLTERDENRVFNAAILIDATGRILLKHRKINVLEIAQDLYSVGDRLGVARTPIGDIGINICADNFPNSLDIGRALGRMGAQIVLSPSAWAVDDDHDNVKEPYGQLWTKSYGQLAREFQMPIAGASNVGPVTSGPWAGRKCIGCSLIIDSRGSMVAMGPYNEEAVVVAEVELASDRPKGTAISGMI